MKLSEKATMVVEKALVTILQSDKKIERIAMNVSPHSQLAACHTVETKYGHLRVQCNPFVPKGCSYLIEDPGVPLRGFAWVVTNKPSYLSEIKKTSGG